MNGFEIMEVRKFRSLNKREILLFLRVSLSFY